MQLYIGEIFGRCLSAIGCGQCMFMCMPVGYGVWFVHACWLWGVAGWMDGWTAGWINTWKFMDYTEYLPQLWNIKVCAYLWCV